MLELALAATTQRYNRTRTRYLYMYEYDVLGTKELLACTSYVYCVHTCSSSYYINSSSLAL